MTMGEREQMMREPVCTSTSMSQPVDKLEIPKNCSIQPVDFIRLGKKKKNCFRLYIDTDVTFWPFLSSRSNAKASFLPTRLLYSIIEANIF